MSPSVVTAEYLEKQDYLSRCQRKTCLMCTCLYVCLSGVRIKFFGLHCSGCVCVCRFLNCFYIKDKSAQCCSMGNCIGHEEKIEVLSWCLDVFSLLFSCKSSGPFHSEIVISVCGLFCCWTLQRMRPLLEGHYYPLCMLDRAGYENSSHLHHLPVPLHQQHSGLSIQWVCRHKTAVLETIFQSKGRARITGHWV